MAEYQIKCPALYEDVHGRAKEIVGELLEEGEQKFGDKTFRVLRHNLLDSLGRFTRSIDTAWNIAEEKDSVGR